MDRKERGEGAVGADHGPGVGERGPRGGLRAADLEADDRLAGLGAAGERIGELPRAANGLEEEPDRAGRLVLCEVVEELCRAADHLPAGGDHGAEADAGADPEQRLGDRARLADDRDAAGPERLRHRPDPERELAGRSDAHAVRPEEDDALLDGAVGDPAGDVGPCGAGLGCDNPPGVGMARKPPVFMKAGDTVVIEIEGLGRLENPIGSGE